MPLAYSNVRIVECGTLLSGRLTALLMADQGAEVLIVADHECKNVKEFNAETNAYLNRGKTNLNLNAKEKADLIKSADIVIVDGESDECQRSERQLLLRVCAALPGDAKYGHLPHDCDDDFLSALVGFYTDMALSHFLDRPVVYTPLRLCSVYAGALGAVACGAALVDRERSNLGREIQASRLAAGVSAIGALSLTIDGDALPKHLISEKISHLRKGLDMKEFEVVRKEAVNNPLKQLWLEQRLFPLASPYPCSDGSLFLPMATFNRGIARRMADLLGIWPKMQQMGIVDVTAYDAKNLGEQYNNLALPLQFSWQMGSALAAELELIFKTKTAKEWEALFCENKIACADVLSFQQWFEDEETRKAKIVTQVEGQWQLGRSAWTDSAKPYPDLLQVKELEGKSASDMLTLLLKSKAEPSLSKSGRSAWDSGAVLDPMKPLKGTTVIDLTNVIAGPACGRVLAELGATVYKVGSKLPDHAPVVMVTWQAEEMIGKQSIMLDLQTEPGKKVLRQLLTKADIALANKLDDQLEKMGIGRSTLDAIIENNGKGPKIIQVQVAARKGEVTDGVQAANWSGYDPALQGKTGLMERFGPKGCPTFHGVASCVDYLCGYMGSFAAVTALYSREANGVISERCGTSLAMCASMVQCNMQGGETHPVEGAVVRGPWARGRTALNRIYQVGQPENFELAAPEHWIYAQAARDLTAEAKDFTGTRDEFIVQLSKQGILATPVHTCKQIAEISKTVESKSLQFEKREAEGLLTETWKPTWFCYNGVPNSCPGAAAPSGVHAPRILMEVCGYSEDEVHTMYDKNIVLPIYWDAGSGDHKTQAWKDAHVWPGQEGRSSNRLKMNPTNFIYKNPVRSFSTVSSTTIVGAGGARPIGVSKPLTNCLVALLRKRIIV